MEESKAVQEGDEQKTAYLSNALSFTGKASSPHLKFPVSPEASDAD